jgi:hypothetical protein
LRTCFETVINKRPPKQTKQIKQPRQILVKTNQTTKAEVTKQKKTKAAKATLEKKHKTKQHKTAQNSTKQHKTAHSEIKITKE